MSTQMEALVSAHADVSKMLTQYGFGPSDHQLEADAQNNQNDLPVGNEGRFLAFNEEMKNLTSTVRETVDTLTQLLRLRTELAEAKQKLQVATLARQSSNLLCSQALEERLDWCSRTIDHLASVSSKRDLLLYYLQQPPAHSCLTMPRHYHRSVFLLTMPRHYHRSVFLLTIPRHYHREFEEVLHGLCEIINNTCTNVSLLQHSPNAHFQPALERCISTLSHLHGSLRMFLNDISALQQLPAGGVQEDSKTASLS
ncbi:HAUS augmin-like complex subunit 2 [Trinorchestia longiramus]|nr:HAUS augmin-like complex subunit 2 [Trinorchestia longiramus]